VARGKAIYAEQQCGSCHGERGRGDGPAAKLQKDSDGRPIAVRDFTQGVFRGGDTRTDLYYRFVTGMDGSPMPSFGDLVQGNDRWALVDYVMSLRVPAPKRVWPSDAIKAGRALAAARGCRGCHVLDDGKGGDAGPDLRISAQKLGADWIKTFLSDTRRDAPIYPWRTQRMPKLGLSAEEIDVATRYLIEMGKRQNGGRLTVPDTASFPTAKLDEGKTLFLIRCTECHQLGKVIETPVVKQQGPDLIRVAGRVDYEWAKRWIIDPKKVDPKTKMTVPGITPEQAEAVRMFVWKASAEGAQAAR
jgi:mono/diheme cytochrome c family protein